MGGEFSAIFLVKATALVVLLASGMLVYRTFPQRYLLLWNGGWALYLVHMAVTLQGEESFIAKALLLASQGLIAGSVGMATDERAPFRWVLPPVLLALILEALAPALAPTLQGWPVAAGYWLAGLLGAAWILQYGRRSFGWGPWLLAFALALRLVHLPLFFQQPLSLSLETAGAILAMVAMQVLTLEVARKQLRWGAAPGTIAAVAADHYAARERQDKDASAEIAANLARVFDAAYANFTMLSSDRADADAALLLASMPRPAPGRPLCPTILEPEKGPEAASWLEQHGLRWAVVIPVPGPGPAPDQPTAIFAMGYRSRRWVSPETMEALVSTGRQLGVILENRRLLDQLSQAYRDWVNTVDAIGDLILVHDAEFRIDRVNRALAERVGRLPTEMIHKKCREALAPPPGAAWKDCPFCEQPGDGDTYDENFGGYFLVSTSRYPREDPVEILHVVKDITDRKRAEEKYRSIFEQVHEGVFIASRAGHFLDFNDAFARMLGYSREELLAADISALYLEEGGRERYLERMDAQGYVRDYEVRLRRKSGDAMIALETSFGTRDESGRVVQLQGFLLDITARKLAEEQLQRHAGMLSAINELAEHLAASLDTRELLRVVVRELRRIFSLDTVRGYTFDPDTHEIAEVASEGAADAPDGGRAFPITFEFLAALRADRRAVISLADLPALAHNSAVLLPPGTSSSVFVVPLRGERDRVIGGITMAWRQNRQLTAAEANVLGAVGRHLSAALENARLYEQTRRAYEELRRTQEQLLQSEKMAALGQLVSGVAHELNNPLTAIIGYSQLLSPYVSGRGSEFVDKLLRQARRTERIIQNLLSFSRQRKPERLHVDLNKVVEDTLLLRDFDMRVGNVRVVRHLCANLPPVIGDPHQLEQVFLNIINNACDAVADMHTGATLTVHTCLEDSFVTVRFSDNGPGMKEPARVFDPFYTTKTVGKGTGLGLSICYGIIKEHGGDIAAENNPEGGATFRVRLPAVRAESAVPAPESV